MDVKMKKRLNMIKYVSVILVILVMLAISYFLFFKKVSPVINIIQSDSTGSVIVGYIPYATGEEAYIAKFDRDNNLLWENGFNSTKLDTFEYVETEGYGYKATGKTKDGLQEIIAIYDEMGNTLSEEVINITNK